MKCDVHRIEACYARSRFIKEICVLGCEGTGAAEIAPHAVVVPDLDLMRARQIVNIGDLLRFEIEGQSIHLSPGERIASYEIWFERLPRTAASMVDRVAVAALVDKRKARGEATVADVQEYDAADGVAGSIAGVIAERTQGAIRPSANLEIDLGFDSMARVALIGELEARFGVTVSQAGAHEWLTVSDLVTVFTRAGATRCGAVTTDPWRALLQELPSSDSGIGFILQDRPLTTGAIATGMRVVRSLITRISVTGGENLPPRGPYIIAPNHQSYLDPFFVCSVLPYGLVRQLFVLGASEYFETALTSWVARRFNLVPVDPDAKLVEAMRAAAFGLVHGRILLVFPEGERSIDGGVKRFKKGASILSRCLQVPIVPAAIDGAFDVWPRNRPFNWRGLLPWRRHHVRVAFGAPMPPDAAAQDDLAAQSLRDGVNAMWQTLRASP